MSPILKRDVGEHARHAKRLASAITGYSPASPEDQEYNTWDTSGSTSKDGFRGATGEGYATASSRRGIGIDEDEENTGPPFAYAHAHARPSWEGRTFVQPKADQASRGEVDEDEDDDDEDLVYRSQEVSTPFIEDTGLRNTDRTRDGETRYPSRTVSEWAKGEVFSMSPSRWIDLRNLLLEVCGTCLSLEIEVYGLHCIRDSV